MLSIALILILSVSPAVFAYIADPFQVFHRSLFPHMGLAYNQRYQNAGLINSFLADPLEGYDSVLVGTSLSENFKTEIAQQELKWHRPLRLFLSGGSPKELAAIIKRSLSKSNTKHLLWELRPRTYSLSTNDTLIDKSVFPIYLYNNNPFDDLPYLFNFDILKMSWYIWRGYHFQFTLTADTIGYWGGEAIATEQHKFYNSIGNISALKKQKTVFQPNQTDVDKMNFPVIDEEVFPILARYCNSDVELVLFIPPVSKIDYLDNSDYAFRAMRTARHILDNTKNCQNIRLHAFDLMAFTNDMNNYKDREHYMPHISAKILNLMGNHQNILTLQNIDAYEAGYIHILENYTANSSYDPSH